MNAICLLKLQLPQKISKKFVLPNMSLVVSLQGMRNDNKPNPYHHAFEHCEMDFLYSLNNPVISTISNFTDRGDKGGIWKTYKFTGKTPSLKYTCNVYGRTSTCNGTWENNSTTVIFFFHMQQQ